MMHLVNSYDQVEDEGESSDNFINKDRTRNSFVMYEKKSYKII